MIHEIGSSIPTFRTLTFRAGLNILLADQSSEATDKDSRNSLGKSSMLEIVHFLLGSSISADSPFKAKALRASSYWGRFTIGGTRLRVERRVHSPDKVFVSFESPPAKRLMQEDDLLDPYTSIKDWTAWLGNQIFDLPLIREGTDFENGGPSFRSLFGYFARRRSDQGFIDPVKYANAIPDNDAQVALCYLFGLDWTIARAFEELKQTQKNLASEVRSKGRANPELKTLAAVTAEHLVIEQRASIQRDALSNLQVAEHYDELVNESAAAKREAETLSLSLAEVTNVINHIEASFNSETTASLADVEKLYQAVGFQLPESARRGIERVEAFHESVISNRRHHLSEELNRNIQRRDKLEGERRAQTKRRTEILSYLSDKGAFSDLGVMQRRLAELDAKVASLAAQKDALQELEDSKSQNRISRIKLKGRFEADMGERKLAVRAAILAVDDALNALYTDGRQKFLRIESTETGPKFIIWIAGDRSGGIANMEVFSMDYGLYKVVSGKMNGPRFLVHDSHLFDGVDPRQTSTAIELGSNLADKVGGQYIVTLNSDKFDKLAFSQGFDALSKVMPVRLEDSETGGLFGFRFE
ncbi:MULTISPECIES: DUF2326 domain-containing protein [Rhizobium]|uniref:DUF2326 domain-containing protein n=1 Tax=Rhizobium johnstonii (strain DSM 114642 / LMG 32736 / 3841) TaxID=216596 RepID=Q1MHB5_RHIJ3|nr:MULTISPECIES: DUF2326 domain-containing protein [Rhizobium]NEI92357.1 DUF2326 domain-containing protein [Rhizobium leguminosarum]NEJ79113.1 DUF2326 domain-containing protein [Rhizobium leguminosarum]CAK07650.1 conserved hypothetical protein [Rhizobium johnstonii 3841]